MYLGRHFPSKLCYIQELIQPMDQDVQCVDAKLKTIYLIVGQRGMVMARTRTSGTKPHVSARALVPHNGSFGQIWDKRLSLVTLYDVTIKLWIPMKRFQGFILALIKNTYLSFTPSKLGKTCYFNAFSYLFQTGVTLFLASTR